MAAVSAAREAIVRKFFIGEFSILSLFGFSGGIMASTLTISETQKGYSAPGISSETFFGVSLSLLLKVRSEGEKFMKLLRNAVLLLSAIVAAHTAVAGEIKPYSQATFDSLAAQGKPVLIEVYADWCPTCRMQRPVLDSLLREPRYKDLTMLVIDFDRDKDLLRTYRVRMQSTIIVFKGKQELGRSVASVDQQSIEELLNKAIN